MKKFFFYIFAVGLFVAGVGYFVGPVGESGDTPLTNLMQNLKKKESMKVAGHEIQVEIANTTEGRRLGLSGRDGLDSNTGMLFVFETSGKPTFWMKDMNFPIDIIWIDEAEIVAINKNVPAEPNVSDGDLTRYYSDHVVKYVLEVPAGYSDANGINVGDTIELPESVQ